jgi:hypothetical protein
MSHQQCNCDMCRVRTSLDLLTIEEVRKHATVSLAAATLQKDKRSKKLSTMPKPIFDFTAIGGDLQLWTRGDVDDWIKENSGSKR